MVLELDRIVDTAVALKERFREEVQEVIQSRKDSDQKGIKLVLEKSRELEPLLTDAQKKVILWYSSAGMCHTINRYLRNFHNKGTNQDSMKHIKETAEELYSIFSYDITFSHPTYRGASTSNLVQLKPGDCFADNGFMSSSGTPEKATCFQKANEENFALIKLYHSSGVPIASFARKIYQGEAEVLFRPLTLFQIESIEPAPENHYHINNLVVAQEVKGVPETEKVFDLYTGNLFEVSDIVRKLGLERKEGVLV